MSDCFITVSFQGFCGWSLVVYDRLLVPSNPANGVLRYKDNYYAFSDKQAAYEFANAPDRCEIISLVFAVLVEWLHTHTKLVRLRAFLQETRA